MSSIINNMPHLLVGHIISNQSVHLISNRGLVIEHLVYNLLICEGVGVIGWPIIELF